MAEEGAIERGRKRSLVPAGALPEVAVVEIFGEDPDGEPLGRPAEWAGEGPAPSILILPGREEASAPGRGERVLARIARTKDGATPYEARIIKRLGASAHRVLGVLRLEPGQPPRIEPIDRKTRYALAIGREDLSGAKNGELVLAGAHGAARRRRTAGPHRRAAGFDGRPQGRQPDRHSRPRHPDRVSREALQEAQSAKPVGIAGRTDLRKTRSSPSIRKTRAIMTTRCGRSPIPIRPTKAAISSSSPSPMSRIT